MVTASGTGSAERGGVGRREEDVERVAPDGLPQMRLLPPRPAPGVRADQPDVDRASRKREGQRLGRIEHEAPSRRVGPRRPPHEQLGEIAPDTGRFAEQLARVDADRQGPGHERDRRLSTAAP